MKRLVVATALVLTASACPAGAPESADALAARLGSRTFAEREAAARKLEKLGVAALPALRASFRSADLETRRRAVVVMERIEDRLLHDEIVTPTPVRLQFTKVPLTEAAFAAAREMGLVNRGTNRTAPITVDTGELPYWQAWQVFCKAAQLEEWDRTHSCARLKTISKEEAERVTTLQSRSGMPSRTNVAMPPIEFEPTPGRNGYAADTRSSVRVRVKWHNAADEPGYAPLAVEVRCEPRLELVEIPRAEVSKIVDEDGRVHAVAPRPLFTSTQQSAAEVFLSLYAGEIQYGGLLQLKSIPWKGRHILLKEVHGRVRLEVMVRAGLMEIPDVLKGVGKEVRGYEGIGMKVLAAERDGARVHLRIRFDDVESLTPKNGEGIVRIRPGVIAVLGAMDVALQRIDLRDERGRKCKVAESSYTNLPEGGHVAQVVFEANSSPPSGQFTLTLTKAPRRTTVDVPFLVRDVPPRLAPDAGDAPR